MPPNPNTTEETNTSDSVSARDSRPLYTPNLAPESPINAETPVSLNNDNPENSPVLTEKPEEPKPAENDSVEPISEPTQVSEARTAQIPVNEPLESSPVSAPQPQPVSAPIFVEPQKNKTSLARELLIKARNAIQFRKRKKLDRVMTLFLKKSKITNDEVEKFLHVSDATAERYLNILENVRYPFFKTENQLINLSLA